MRWISRDHRNRIRVWSIIFGLLFPLISSAQDQLIFNNGDVVSGKFLGQTETIIYFESDYLGTLKVPMKLVSVKLEDKVNVSVETETTQTSEAPANRTEPKKAPVERSEKRETTITKLPKLPDIQSGKKDAGALASLWESAEKTLNRFVHDRVPSWFPSLPEDWKGNLRLGFNYNESQTTNNRYSGSFSLEGDKPKSNYLAKYYFAFAKQGDNVSEDDWGSSFRYRYKIQKQGFVETLLTHDVDELRNPAERSTGSVGVGWKPYNKKNLKLDFVAGGAAERVLKQNDDSTTGFKLNLNENFQWNFNPHMKLKQSLRFYIDPQNNADYNFRFESGLETLIIGAFNLGLTYRLDYDSTIKDESARQKTRVITSIGVKF